MLKSHTYMETSFLFALIQYFNKVTTPSSVLLSAAMSSPVASRMTSSRFTATTSILVA